MDKNNLDARKKAKIQEILEILEILKNNGIDLTRVKREIKRDGKYRSSLLKEIEQPGIDIMRIIEQYSLNPNWKIGYRILELNRFYKELTNLNMTEEKERIEKLGKIEVKTEAAKTLELLELLEQNGVDVTKINMIIRIDGTRRGVLLKEINQPEIDIMKIIEKYGLDPNDNIGGKIQRINQGYKGRADNPITEKDKQKAERLGIIRNKLTNKEKEQQQLQDKAKEARKLRDTTQTVIDVSQNSK